MNWSSIESFKVPPLVTVIGKSSFYHCKELKKFSFSDCSNLTIIDNEAIYKSSIVSISIPYSVKKIGRDAFSSCKMLQIIEINDNPEIENCEQSISYDCKNAIYMIPYNAVNRVLNPRFYQPFDE